MKITNLIPNEWETEVLTIKDSIIEDSEKLMSLHLNANAYMKNN